MCNFGKTNKMLLAIASALQDEKFCLVFCSDEAECTRLQRGLLDILNMLKAAQPVYTLHTTHEVRFKNARGLAKFVVAPVKETDATGADTFSSESLFKQLFLTT